MIPLLQVFQSRRTRQINETLRQITRTVSGYLLSPSTLHVGIKLQKEMAAQGIEMSLEEACKRVATYKPRQRR